MRASPPRRGGDFPLPPPNPSASRPAPNSHLHSPRLTRHDHLACTLASKIPHVDSLWVETFRYHRWANLHLLDVSEKLSADQLQLTAPGTYGTIATTWQHLLSAEQRYLRRLSGIEPQLSERDAFPGVAALKEHATRTGDQLLDAATRITPDDSIETKFDDRMFKLHLGVVIIQALHHGNDHRTHICTILGHHGIEYGDMDVWAYGEASGATVPIPSKP